jgi:predicted metal-dependent hydrolase
VNSAKMKETPKNLLHGGTKEDYKKLKDQALDLALRRLKHFNAFYKFDYKKVAIGNQKTRWGSCTSTGTLSFNYKIVYLPPEAADYIVVHELCHLAQMNHSIKFWKLVEKTVANYRLLRQQLRSTKGV